MPHPTSSNVLLTVDDVRGWIAERAELQKKIVELNNRSAEIDRIFRSILPLLPDDLKREINNEDDLEEDGQKKQFSTTVQNILSESGVGHSFKSITKALEGTEFIERINRNPNSLYNLISRLTDRGIVKRVGSLIFDANVLDTMIKEGREPLENALEIPDNNPSVPEMVLAIVAGAPDGLRTAELIAKAKENASLNEKIQKNPQYIYTVIGRMTKRGQLRREENLYFIP